MWCKSETAGGSAPGRPCDTRLGKPLGRSRCWIQQGFKDSSSTNQLNSIRGVEGPGRCDLKNWPQTRKPKEQWAIREERQRLWDSQDLQQANRRSRRPLQHRPSRVRWRKAQVWRTIRSSWLQSAKTKTELASQRPDVAQVWWIEHDAQSDTDQPFVEINITRQARLLALVV